jgi:4-alpha-glucanotransferase
MKQLRAAGILLHPSSLPGAGGIGDFGDDAHRFLDFLADAGIRIWQMLPLGPTGYGESPYQCLSAFAGNPLFIALARETNEAGFDSHRVDFERVIPHHRARLAERLSRFRPTDAYRAFVAAHDQWLPDYALFTALKEAFGGAVWTEWEPGAALREPVALAAWRAKLAMQIERVMVEQYFFFAQFDVLRAAAKSRGIQLMGDLPLYVAHDSADVWAHRALFKLDAAGRPLVQAGVPPDYFSATGQLWGNPVYDWDAMANTGFGWWIERVRHVFTQFDLVRLDHFRGLEAYWEVPGDDTTAINGVWQKAPGDALFAAIAAALGALPIIAENLGLITPEVEALRERYHLPGMSILQFAFGLDAHASAFRPHNLERESVVYTGTHDNDTTLGWWQSTGEGDSTRAVDEAAAERAMAARYLASDGTEMNWDMIRAALASVANTAVIPIQDVLGLGSEARMNMPGRADGNWRFRFSWDQLPATTTARLRDLVETYQR